MRRMSCLGILAGLAAPTAAFGQAAGPVPDKWRIDQSYSGQVTALGYFSPAEEADPAWEAKRVAWATWSGRGPRRHVIRRDVRWFAPARPGDPPCARVVYTTEYAGREGQGAADAHRNEITRLTFFAAEPYSPMEPGCGNKEPVLVQRTDDGAYDRWSERRAEAMRVTDSRCDAVQRDPTTPMRIYPGTRLWVRTAIDRALPEARAPSVVFMLAHYPDDVIERRSWSAFRPSPPVINFGTLPDDGRNILITQLFGRSRNGEGYCVQLTARQGERVWSRVIDRPVAVPERNDMTDRMGLPRDPDHYWQPGIDARALAGMLASDLGIPKLPPLPD
jgi:hypothetical protein